MKKKNLVIMLTACLLTVCFCFAGILSIQSAADRITPVTPQVFKTVNGYNYNISETFPDSPDSIEMWINVPATSLGGTIMGNRHNKEYECNAISLEIDSFGYFAFGWNEFAVSHTFVGTQSLFDDQWHHIALVRTENSFTYYLDGEVEAVYEVKSEPMVNKSTVNIGVDKRCWLESKTPFEGYIRQLTVYTGAITQAQVESDITNSAITSADNVSAGTRLMGNWYFGDEWTKRVVESSEPGTPVANLNTFEKYVGADYSFGDYDYTFVIIPDIQIMTNYNTGRLNYMTQWLVDNKERLNIEFVIQVGDLSDTGRDEQEYIDASRGMSRLDNNIPYCFVPGNHDYNDNFASRDTGFFNKYYPVSKHSQLPGFGGVYEENKMENSYYLFEAGDVEYLVLNLEFRPRMKVLRWAGRVIEQFPDRRVIVMSHEMIHPFGNYVQSVSAGFDVTASQQMFDCLISKYPNVFMAVGGHHCYDDIVYRTDYGVNGNKVLGMLVDGQGTKYQGSNAQDMVLLCHVNESDKTINFVYYSPEQGKVWNIQNQFEVNFADEKNPTVGA
ncbi:MAG: metallophosphoesterase [Clostridia bacterium]|nr:metallophosphoesterase [Clostridia bacterium]